jgi:hypothetical protein
MVRESRFVLVKVGASRFAIPTCELAHISRHPKFDDWRGNGVVRSWCSFEGYVVWILDPCVLFEGASKQVSIDRAWLIIFKSTGGLSRLGMFADDVKGPYGHHRIGGHLVVKPRTF